MPEYDSGNDSGDDLFEGHETIATEPLSRPPHLSYDSLKSQLAASDRVTQPTQILETPPKPVVQVAASSPLRSSPLRSSPVPQPQHRRPLLGHSMAPPGTAFRRPVPAQPARAPILSDGEDSDPDEVEEPSRADIKPTTFAAGTSGANRSFTSQIESFRFQAPRELEVPKKRPVDDVASAYANARPAKRPMQKGPARAQPVMEEREMTLDDVADWDVRNKIKQIQEVLPDASIRQCQAALARRRGNVSDAIDFIATTQEKEKAQNEGPDELDLLKSPTEARRPPPLASSDVDELDLLRSPEGIRPSQRTQPPKPAAKRGLEGQKRNINEKWSRAQNLNPSRPPPTTITIDDDDSPVSAKKSPKARLQEIDPSKPRRRLQRGIKKQTETVELSDDEAPTEVTPAVRNKKTAIEESDDDSGVADEPEEEEDERYGDLLEFFNKCSVEALCDLSGQTEEMANLLISKRPFKRLDRMRALELDTPEGDPQKRGKRAPKKRSAAPMVDTCEEMWEGYKAVDNLVAECSARGKPVAAAMAKWGVNVFGKNSDAGGELELTNICDARSEHDSGIGTPSGEATDEEADADVVVTGSSRRKLLGKPSMMSDDIELKDYQIVGLNWMNLLWTQQMSCILADDMGLGKTCQVISFLSHLKETGVTGVHLIIVPSSTLENWLREFKHFSPGLKVEPYYGNLKELDLIRANIEEKIAEIDVIVTTYDRAYKHDDRRFLRRLEPVVCVFDEAHTLKNAESKRYGELIRIRCKMRILLTGTPLQNNLQELVSLLAFLMPDIFADEQERLKYVFKYKAKATQSDHASLLSAERVRRARSMLTPFILRRKKQQVLKDLPPKHCRIEYCELTATQKEIYSDILARQRKRLEDQAAGIKNKETTNPMMLLRQAAIHPTLTLRKYKPELLKEMAEVYSEAKHGDVTAEAVFTDLGYMAEQEKDIFIHQQLRKEEHHNILDDYLLTEEDWMDSGKVQSLTALIRQFRANGDRTLVFSQFTGVMDILENVLDYIDCPFLRLDGSTNIADRQDLIDLFYKDDSIPVFMLSTKSGGAGINLAAANKVIIFDASFNPQDDVQAENRAHRVGQKKEVDVIRLVTRGTIEEQILALGESKLALDAKVAGEEGAGGADDAKAAKQIEGRGEKLVAKMLEDELKKSSTQMSQDTDTGPHTQSQIKGSGDMKTQFMDGLKKAGLDLSAA